MKVSHENLALIEDWLIKNNLEVEISDSFIRRVYSEVLEASYSLHLVESVAKRKRYYTLQYDFVRRDLLKIKYKRNNLSAKGIQQGFVYAIANPAWGDYIKVGSAIDVYDRLNSYQTSSPLRDYYIVDYFYSDNRVEAEREIHNMFVRNSEWCNVSLDILRKVFKDKKIGNSVEVLEDTLYAVKRAKENEALKALELEESKRQDKIARKKKFFENERRRKAKQTMRV